MSTVLVNSEPASVGAVALDSTLLPKKDPMTLVKPQNNSLKWTILCPFYMSRNGGLEGATPSHTASRRPGCMGAGTHPAPSVSLYRLHEEVASFLSPHSLISANNVWEDEDMEVGADIPCRIV